MADKVNGINGVNGVNGINGVNGNSLESTPKWQRPDLPSRCTYKVGACLKDSPHRHVPM